jgi:hypothetical protein
MIITVLCVSISRKEHHGFPLSNYFKKILSHTVHLHNAHELTLADLPETAKPNHPLSK